MELLVNSFYLGGNPSLLPFAIDIINYSKTYLRQYANTLGENHG